MQIGLVLVIFLVCCSIFVNGWTDAPNALTTVVSTRVLTPRKAVILAAIFNLLGVLLMGTAVAKTIGNMVALTPGKDGLISLAAAQLSIVIWAVSAWRFGIPTSESHALIAGLTGAALAKGGLASVSWGWEWQKVLWGLVISSVLGFVTGWFFTWLTARLFKNVNRHKANRFFSIAQLFSAGAMAFSHGAQDGQKFMGVLAFALVLGGILPASGAFAIPVYIMVFCAVLMAIGTSVGGYRIIKTMGMDMVKIEKYQGFASEIAASACMLSATVFGIPLSTTNTKGTSAHGRGGIPADVQRQLGYRQGDGDRLGAHVSRVRADRICDGADHACDLQVNFEYNKILEYDTRCDMAKKEINYYEAFEKGIGFCLQSARMLQDLLERGTMKDEEFTAIKKVESEADSHMHVMCEHLNVAFITPIDRDDIYRIAKETDDIVDSIDAVSGNLWMMRVEKVTPPMKEMAGLHRQGLRAAPSADDRDQARQEELQVIRADHRHQHILRNMGDRCYKETLRELYTKEKDPIELFKMHKV